MREKWWGRSWDYLSDTNCPAKVKVNIIRRESWSEFNTKCNLVTWSFLFQNVKPTLRWVISPIKCSCSYYLSKPSAPQTSLPHDGSSYFLLLSPLISHKVGESHFPYRSCLIQLAQPWEVLSQNCCLSVTSTSEHKPRIPKIPLLLHLHRTFRLLYISAHMFVFKVNNKCNIKHPWLLHWTALSASCCKTDLILIVAGLWLN